MKAKKFKMKILDINNFDDWHKVVVFHNDTVEKSRRTANNTASRLKIIHIKEIKKGFFR